MGMLGEKWVRTALIPCFVRQPTSTLNTHCEYQHRLHARLSSPLMLLNVVLTECPSKFIHPNGALRFGESGGSEKGGEARGVSGEG
jgi:hypothetical protein